MKEEVGKEVALIPEHVGFAALLNFLAHYSIASSPLLQILGA